MRFLKKKETIDPRAYITSSGSRKKKVYGPRFDGKKLFLMETGEIDIQDEINSHAIECDMNYILSRLGNGDLSVLNGNSPIFADFHDLPSNFREVMDVALNSERIFNTLPIDVRKEFGNDYRQWVSAAGTDRWNEIMNVDQSSGAPELGKEVNVDEGHD